MAAPTVDKSRQNACLNKVISREKSTKPTQKNILCPVTVEWPRPSKTTEEAILSKLTETLQSLPNIFNSKTVSDRDPKQKEEKAKIRSQLEIGASSVFRALDHDTLECVLVSGEATPAISVDHIISVGREKGCPLLCLDGLARTFARVTGSKVMPLTVGFKKLEAGQQNDFAEVVALVKEHAPVTCVPPRSTGGCGQQDVVVKPLANKIKHKPIRVSTDDNQKILDEIKRIFSAAFKEQPEQSKKKKRQKQKKKNVKDLFDKYLQCQFEAGKQCVTYAIERGLIQYVLASHEVEPVLATHDLLKLEGHKSEKLRPPTVIIVPGLTGMLRDISSGLCHLTFLGIKKLARLPPDSRQDMKRLIELCETALEETPTVSTQNIRTENKSGSTSCVGITMSDHTGKSKHEVDDGKKRKDKEEEEEEDYSYLYVLKKDSKDLSEHQAELRSDIEDSRKATTFSTDFISLSSSPVVKSTTETLGNANSSSTAVGSANLNKQNIETSNHKADKSEKCSSKESVVEQTSNSSGFLSFSQPAGGRDTSGVKGSHRREGGESPMDTTAQSDVPVLAFSLDRGKGDGEKGVSANIQKTNLDCSAGDKHNTGLIYLDRSGSGQRVTKTEVSGKGSMASKPTVEAFSSKQVSGPLGVTDLKVPAGNQGIDYLALDASSRSKQKTKALKRKVDKEEGFLSFAYTEANIKTMTCDPTKKRKKKKK